GGLQRRTELGPDERRLAQPRALRRTEREGRCRDRRRPVRGADRRAHLLLRLIAFAAIAPHGGLVFEQPDAPTRRGMEELARRFDAARPEAAIVVTPHGTLVDGHFAVVRSGTLSEHTNRFVAEERLYTGPGDPELAEACVGALQEAGLPALGITFASTVAGDSEMPIDWGSGIPLSFLRAPAAVVTPCRALSNEEHVRAGAALARATRDRRVAFVA